MTSEERKQNRYLRRKAKRDTIKTEFMTKYNDFDTVFSFENLYKSYQKCRCGVSWKASVQRYIAQAPLLILKLYNKLHSGQFKSPGFYEFTIVERGKTRHIRSVTFEERIVQRCLCDNALVPVLGRSFIQDNSASQKGKGFLFASERLCEQLHSFYREHGREGYILSFDFSKYFDSIPHELAKRVIRKHFTDNRLLSLADHFIDAFGECGLGLGSQISQILSLACCDELDHIIKENLRIKGYGRYMDDGYLIHHNKEYLQYCLEVIQKTCNELGIKLNINKTIITPLSKRFVFLKIKYKLTTSGKVIRKTSYATTKRMHRRNKAFAIKLKNGTMPQKSIDQSFQSWMSYVTQFNTYTVIKREIKKYLLMFPAGKILSKKVKNSVLDPFERKTCTADTEKTSS